MRKLIILKIIIDLIWKLSCIPLIPLGLLFSVYMFFNEDVIKTLFSLNDSEITPDPNLKILFIVYTSLEKRCGFFSRGNPLIIR